MKRLIVMASVLAGTLVLFSCRTVPPYPENPSPQAEAAVYENTRIGLYEGMEMGSLINLANRSPLLKAHGSDYIQLIFAFRLPPEEASGLSVGGTMSYLSVIVDRSTKRVVSWEEA